VLDEIGSPKMEKLESAETKRPTAA